MEDNVVVQNLTNDDVVYLDNDGGVERRIVFKGQQELSLPRAMVERMRYDNGGAVLVKDYLSVKDNEIRQAIGVPEDQIEYDYKAEDIIKLLQNNSINEIADALDFGPQGIKEMIAEQAVALPISNRNLMTLIHEKTGKDIETQIKNKEILAAAQEKDADDENKPSGRRVQPKKVEESENTERRVKIINGKEVYI